MNKEEQKEIKKWKKFCEKCGAEMNITPLWAYYSDTGRKYIYSASYRCPNKKHIFDSHQAYNYNPHDIDGDY